MEQNQNFTISNGITRENGFVLFKHFNSPLFNNIRVIAYDNTYNDPWFVGKDVCNVLEYSNFPKALRDHVSLINKRYETIPIDDSGIEITNRSVNYSGRGARSQNMILINQAGLYELANRSKMPLAKNLQDWVCNVVLPTINKVGAFIDPGVGTAIQNGKFNSASYMDYALQNSIDAEAKYYQDIMNYNQLQLAAINSITNQYINYCSQQRQNPNNKLMTVAVDKNIPVEVYNNLKGNFMLLQ